MKQLILLLASSIVLGSGWDTIGSTTSNSGYDPDSIWWTNGYGDTTQLEMIHFITVVPEDTTKNLSADSITDSLFITSENIAGFGSFGAFQSDDWITTLGAWMKVSAGDSVYIQWSCKISSSTDSLSDNGTSYLLYTTDSILVDNSTWTYIEWEFLTPFIIPLYYPNTSFYCSIVGGDAQALLGAIASDSTQPSIYGIDSSFINASKIPNILLYSKGGVLEDSICVVYDDNHHGISFSSLSSSSSFLTTIFTYCIQSQGITDPIEVASPMDFLSSITMSGSATLSDSYIVQVGDTLIVSNGSILEVRPVSIP